MVPMKMQKSDYFALYWKQIFYLFFPLLLELPTLKSWRRICFYCASLFKKLTLGKCSFHELAMLTQVCIECLTAKMPFSTKMWLEKLYRKRLITSALRKDLLQIDGLYARISKLRYEL